MSNPPSPQDSHNLSVRLVITIVACLLSLPPLVRLFYAYRRWHHCLRNHLNDLYVYGICGFLFLQVVQRLVFAVVHLKDLEFMSAVMCDINAVLSQFFEFSAQIFIFAFFVSLLTLRGRWDVCTPCLTATMVISRRYDEEEQQVRGDATGDLNTTLHDVVRVSQRTQTVVSWVNVFWTALAVVGGVISSVVMYAMVVSDPNEVPQPGNPDPKSFEVGLGWCWIPKRHVLLRFLVLYVVWFVTSLVVVVLFGFFCHYEFGSSIRGHLAIYARLLVLFALMLVVDLFEAVGQSIGGHDGVVFKFIATGCTAAVPAAMALLFLITENISVIPCWARSSDTAGLWFSCGFSQCVNHLLNLEVAGVPFPADLPTAATTAVVFREDAVDSTSPSFPSTDQIFFGSSRDAVGSWRGYGTHAQSLP